MDLILDNGLRLTAFRSSDEAPLVQWLNDRAIYERTLRIPFPYTAADAQRWFAIVREATRQNGQPVSWAIREGDGPVLGGVGFDGLVLGQTHRAEIGYWLARPYWGQGIMTAAVRAVCRHALADWRLARLTAHTFAFNDASGRVLLKCGFQFEGYLRKHYCKDGQFLDAKAYGLVAE